MKFLSVCVLLFLCGCSSHVELPPAQYSIEKLYQGANDSSVKRRFRFSEQEPDLSSYSRQVGNELDDLFPELPNPQILIYIAPHLAEGDLPVPGYVTKIRLYKKSHYALPGETAAREE